MMKNFFKNLVLFCLPLIILFLCSSVFSRIIINKYGKFTIDNSKSILILGHSQPECNLNDSLINNSINLAQGGEAYIYTYQKLRKLLPVNPNIKTVLLSFSNNQTKELMTKWSFSDETMETNYPKYNFMMDTNDISLFIKNNVSSFLSSETKAIVSNFKVVLNSNKNKLEHRNWGGYIYLVRNKTDSLIKAHYVDTLMKKKTNKISNVNISYLEKIVDFCKQRNVKIVFMRMPAHKELHKIENEIIFQKIRNSKFKNIPFLDFRYYEATNNEFADLEHLNHIGAKRFSIFLNQLLNNGLLNEINPQLKIDIEMKLIKAFKNDTIKLL